MEIYWFILHHFPRWFCLIIPGTSQITINISGWYMALFYPLFTSFFNLPRWAPRSCWLPPLARRPSRQPCRSWPCRGHSPMGRRTWSRRSCPCHLWSLDLKNHVLTCVEIKGPLAWLEILEMDLFLEISWDMVSHTQIYIYIHMHTYIYFFNCHFFAHFLEIHWAQW